MADYESTGVYNLQNTSNVSVFLAGYADGRTWEFSDPSYFVEIKPNETKERIIIKSNVEIYGVSLLIKNSDAQYFKNNDLTVDFQTGSFPSVGSPNTSLDTQITNLTDYTILYFDTYNYWGDRNRNMFISVAGNINVPAPVTYSKITQNLNNCTLKSIGDGVGGTYTIDTIPVGNRVQFTFELNDNYVWDSITVTNTDTSATIATATIEDKTQNNVTVTVDSAVENMTINANATKKQVEYSNVKLNLTGCTLSSIGDGVGGTYTIDTIPVGNRVQFTLTRNDNTVWDNITVTDNTGKTLATANISNTSINTVSVVVDNAVAIMTVNGNTYADTIPVTTTCTYCTATYTPETLNRGDTLNATFKANNGYYFESLPVIRVNYSIGYQDYDCTLDSDGVTATGSISGTITGATDLTKPISVQLIGVASIKPEIPTVTNSLIKAYKITQNGLKQLATKRWNVSTSEGIQTVDLAYYITSLKRFYFDVESSLDTTLVLYTYNTEIPAKIVASDVVTLDCGNVTIERPNENINDYSNTEIQLMLPFIGFVTLDSNLTVGNTLNVSYDISTITGDCVAKIIVNDIVLYEYNGNCSEDVPYILNNIQWQLQGSVSFNSTSLYGLKPFIIVQYHDNYNSNANIIVNDNNRTVLSNLHGLNYINDVVTDGLNINDDTKELLINTLANGVIF